MYVFPPIPILGATIWRAWEEARPVYIVFPLSTNRKGYSKLMKGEHFVHEVRAWQYIPRRRFEASAHKAAFVEEQDMGHRNLIICVLLDSRRGVDGMYKHIRSQTKVSFCFQKHYGQWGCGVCTQYRVRPYWTGIINSATLIL